ncbi:MAG TPA: alpha/beta hydrolase, partial [Xanthomonadales bacterium]|nr:alpha/beta hydrolase [Xanthomonadales bacterium]
MYLPAEPLQIQRRFVKVSRRHVHYRRAGSGPPLVLLHQSPTSSAEMASSIVAFAAQFTVIAPDTPGYGWSDPLDCADPTMTDYASALAGFLETLGIERSGIFGSHTGAMIAAEFGLRYPERVTAVVLDGYVVLTDAEREDILAHYFESAPPTGDGRHLAWYWSRIRDQVIFFPWYRKSREARMRFDVPPAAFLQPYLLDLLGAAAEGRPAYEAAFRYPARKAALEFTAPTYLLNYTQDAIAHHPERLESFASAVRRECLADPETLQRRASELFSEFKDLKENPVLPAEPT